MPVATLTFNLPEEQEEFETATRAGDYKSVLYEFDQYLRGIHKYGVSEDMRTEGTSDEQIAEIAWKLRHKLRELADGLEY